MTLGEELPRELKRRRELLATYKAIGAAGAFGHAAISACIDEAESAMIEGDLLRMIAAYKALKECEMTIAKLRKEAEAAHRVVNLRKSVALKLLDAAEAAKWFAGRDWAVLLKDPRNIPTFSKKSGEIAAALEADDDK